MDTAEISLVTKSHLGTSMHPLIYAHFQEYEKQCKGTLGISALHFETKNKLSYKGDNYFLLCSTYKIPIAICLLKQIEEGKLQLDQAIEITEFDIRPGAFSLINELDYSSKVQLSVLNLLTLMMQHSCNSATDILLRLIGGPGAVTAMLNNINLSHIRVDRNTLEIMAAWDGITTLPHDHRLTIAEYKKLESSVSSNKIQEAKAIFKCDHKDRGTPIAMTTLMEKLLDDQLINSKHRALILKIMRRCKTGPKRLMGMLPTHVQVSRKTGTLTGFVSEVAVLELPSQLGHLILSIFINDSTQSVDACEQIIAQTARSVYDYYLFYVLSK